MISLTPTLLAVILGLTVVVDVLMLLAVTTIYNSWPRLKTWVRLTISGGFFALVVVLVVLLVAVLRDGL